MAISTIFEPICIDDPEKAKAFTDALIASWEAPERKTDISKESSGIYVTDIDEIRRFMSKRFPDL